MCNGGGAFSQEEVEYLRSLPAVAEATTRRITYTEAFKHNCVRRYRSGESPVEIFREAGLDPSLIGHKRIERCLARWRGMRCRMGVDGLVPMDDAVKRGDVESAAVRPDAAGGSVSCEGDVCMDGSDVLRFSETVLKESSEKSVGKSPEHSSGTSMETKSMESLEMAAESVESSRTSSAESSDDIRDLLIVQQARRIHELECEVRALRIRAGRSSGERG